MMSAAAGAPRALERIGIPVTPYRGLTPSIATSRNGGLKFCNRRAEDWWRMREELDPEQEFGSAIALPPDASIKADLAAPHRSNRRNSRRRRNGVRIRVQPQIPGGKNYFCFHVVRAAEPALRLIVERCTRTVAPRLELVYVPGSRRNLVEEALSGSEGLRLVMSLREQ